MNDQVSYAPFWTKKVLTIDEVSTYTGFKKSYIYELVSKNLIPYSKPNGKSLFFDREKIESWLLSNPQKSKLEIHQAAMTHIANSRVQKRKT